MDPWSAPGLRSSSSPGRDNLIAWAGVPSKTKHEHTYMNTWNVYIKGLVKQTMKHSLSPDICKHGKAAAQTVGVGVSHWSPCSSRSGGSRANGNGDEDCPRAEINRTHKMINEHQWQWTTKQLSRWASNGYACRWARNVFNDPSMRTENVILI